MTTTNLAASAFGLNAVTDLGLDNTGKADIGPALNAFYAQFAGNVNALVPALLWPRGKYNLATPFKCTATSSTMKNITWIGEGRAAYGGWGSTVIVCNTPLGTSAWFDNSESNKGNEKGPRIEHISFVDGSPLGNCYAGLRITQFNNLLLEDVSFAGFHGASCSTGEARVAKGSRTFSVSGAVLDPHMQFGHLHIGGRMQEISDVGSVTGALTSEWQFASGAFPYLIGYAGKGLMLEGTSANGFTQYGCCKDLWGYDNRVWVHAVGSPSSIAGVSRVRFEGGRNNGNRVADGIGIFLGGFSDTCDVDGTAMNNVAFPVVIESGHAHRISAVLENNAPYTKVSTANNGVASQAYCPGVALNSDAPGKCRDNVIVGGYIYSMGDAIAQWSQNVTQMQIAHVRMRSNLNNYAWADGTVGPPTKPAANPDAITALIHQLDYQGTK